MPGIGETLQRARHERKLTLEQVEEAIRIRARYLAALEAERFDVLPGTAYVRAFTREYASYLGLDPGPLLDRLDEEPGAHEPPPAMLVSQRSGGPGRYWLGVAIVAVIAAIIGWSLSRGHHGTAPPAAVSTSGPATAPIVTTPARTRPVRPRPLPAPKLLLMASRGDCWLSVHLGSATGPSLYEGILPRGQSLRFARTAVWIRIGAPASLDLRLNGRPLALPASGGGAVNVLVTRAGLRSA
jgi:transcriptional regulator with XRE-family HTH domain